MQAEEVRKAGVVGYGLMGSGIAEVLAGAGIEVAVLEPTEALLAAGRERIEASTARAVARGKMDEADRAALLDRVHGTTEAIGFADVDLVIEAATEDEPAKVAIFRSLDEVTKPEVVLGSNTSSIPIATLGAATARPDRVIGLHFFNPPPVMRLIEVTPSILTSDETVAFARAFGERLGKTTVLAKDQAGFIVNRLLIPYLCDAIRLLDGEEAPRTVRPNKGIHVIVPRARLRLCNAVDFAARGVKRTLYAIPWRQTVIVGTTDTDYGGDIDQVCAEKDEVERRRQRG